MKRTSCGKSARESRAGATGKVQTMRGLLGGPISPPSLPKDVERTWNRVTVAALLGDAAPLDIAQIDSFLMKVESLERQVAFYQKTLQLVVESVLPLADQAFKNRLKIIGYNEQKGYVVSDQERQRAKELDEVLRKRFPVASHRRDEIALYMGIKSDRVRTLLGESRKGKPESRGKNRNRSK